MPPSDEREPLTTDEAPTYTDQATLALVQNATRMERERIIDLMRKRADEIAVAVHKASGTERTLLPHGTLDLRALADELERG
jgi:hypothetical protein